MKCSKCGTEVKSTDKFCSVCGAKLLLKPNNKPIYKEPKFLIASIGLLIVVLLFVMITIIGCSVNKSMSKAVKSHTYSHSETTEQPTTENPDITVSENIDYTLKDMTFTIPKDWSYVEHLDNNWIELKGIYGATSQISVENEDLQDSMDDVKNIISDFQSTGITVINSGFEDATIGDQKGSSILYTETIGNIIIYNYVYLVQYEDNTYTLNLSYSSDEAIEDSTVFISDILHSITFKGATTEKTTEVSTTVVTAENSNKVIFDNKGIKVIYTGIENSRSYTDVKVLIENNSGQDYEFQVRDCSINGYMIEPIFSSEVSNGKKINDELKFMKSDLKKNNIDKIESIEFKLHAFNWDDNSNDFDSVAIIINP
jgi:DNA-directed RNA polymerase subunit RPC12/RpoP